MATAPWYVSYAPNTSFNISDSFSAFQSIFPLLLLFGLYWVPESPRYLAMKGLDDQAFEVLKSLHPNDPSHIIAQAELFQIQRQLELDRTFGSSWIKVAKKPSYIKRFWIAFSVAAILQCCGQQVITSEMPLFYFHCPNMILSSWQTMGRRSMEIWAMARYHSWHSKEHTLPWA
jgi:hypothetical protein